MDKPVIAGKRSIKLDVKKGEVYYWCKCGLSQKQPFCDGSHKGTGFEPVKYIAEEDRLFSFCSCKQTADPPRCDNKHRELT